MRVSFAAGDVGGARAILPVARLAATRGLQVRAMRHGVLSTEGDPGWVWADSTRFADSDYWDPRQDLLFYATSVKDMAAPLAAREAQGCGCPIVHVLDNWSTYARRLRLADGSALIPDAYAVMDGLAARRAREDGVPQEIIHVTGHPGLARLADEAAQSPGPTPGAPVDLLFVSEPASVDGAAVGTRGYDEIIVAQLLAAELVNHRHLSPMVHVCPHPREDRDAVFERWAELGRRHGFQVSLVAACAVRQQLHHAQLVIGMTSILLYEAWLLGKPVLSLQPGLQSEALSELRLRHGVLFCQVATALPEMLATAMHRATEGRAHRNDDLLLHADAAARTLDLGISLFSSKLRDRALFDSGK